MSIQQDGQRFARKLRRAPVLVARHMRPAMETGATEMVAMMRQFAPEFLRDSIKWKWGAAPRGAVILDRVGGRGDLQISIYSADRRAHWWEFGTADRYQKSTGRYVGRITAQPFFWPAYRLLRRRVRRRMNAAMRRGIREAMAG